MLIDFRRLHYFAAYADWLRTLDILFIAAAFAAFHFICCLIMLIDYLRFSSW